MEIPVRKIIETELAKFGQSYINQMLSFGVLFIKSTIKPFNRGLDPSTVEACDIHGNSINITLNIKEHTQVYTFNEITYRFCHFADNCYFFVDSFLVLHFNNFDMSNDLSLQCSVYIGHFATRYGTIVTNKNMYESLPLIHIHPLTYVSINKMIQEKNSKPSINTVNLYYIQAQEATEETCDKIEECNKPEEKHLYTSHCSQSPKRYHSRSRSPRRHNSRKQSSIEHYYCHRDKGSQKLLNITDDVNTFLQSIRHAKQATKIEE